MKPGGSMSHSQWIYNNTCPEPMQRSSSYWYVFLIIVKNSREKEEKGNLNKVV